MSRPQHDFRCAGSDTEEGQAFSCTCGLADLYEDRAKLVASASALRFVHEKLAPGVEVDWAVPLDVASAVVDESRDKLAAAEKEQDETLMNLDDVQDERDAALAQVATLTAERGARGLKVAEAVREASAVCVEAWDHGASARIRSMDLTALLKANP